MTDVIFGLITVVLIVCFGYYVRESNKEKAKLINALIAKTPQDAANLELASKWSPIKKEEKDPDLVPLDQMSDEDFDKHIQQTITE